jgi:uncharacterized protein YndB with AHSA1/START domain
MKARIDVSTRRDLSVAIAGIVSSFAFGALSSKVFGQHASTSKGLTETNPSLRTSLHQQIDLPAPPKRVFEVLSDSKQFAAVTGLSAEIDSTSGGAFKTFGGLIEGRNVELIAGQRIVQAWREASWEPGFYSLVHFELTEKGEETSLVLDHSGFHEGDFSHLDPGWHERYWEPLKRYLIRPQSPQ